MNDFQNDTEIWDSLRNGQKLALELIYRKFAPDLIKYGHKFSENEQLIEDCIQDLFIELWKNHKGLGRTDAIKPYLLAAIRRKIIRKLQQDKKWVLSNEDHSYPFDLELASDEQMIESEMHAEQVKKLKTAFDSLSNRQQEAIYLKYYSGLEYEEIGKIMNINYQSLRNLVSAALKKMKDNVGALLFILVLCIFFCFF